MCFVAYIKKKDGLEKQEIKNFLNKAISESYFHADGWGVMDNKGNIYKKAKKFAYTDIKELLKKLKKPQYLILHLRLKTSGIAIYGNTQPIKKEDTIIAHNGILNYPISQKKSDSAQLVEKLASRKKFIRTLTKELTENGGSYNLFVQTPLTLSFITNQTSYAFCKKDELILGANDKDWLKSYFVEHNGLFTSKPKLSWFIPEKFVLYDVEDEPHIIKRLDITEGYGWYNQPKRHRMYDPETKEYTYY